MEGKGDGRAGKEKGLRENGNGGKGAMKRTGKGLIASAEPEAQVCGLWWMVV